MAEAMEEVGKLKAITISGYCSHIPHLLDHEEETFIRAKNIAASARVYEMRLKGTWPYTSEFTFGLPVKDLHTALEVLVGNTQMSDDKLVWLVSRHMHALDNWTEDAGYEWVNNDEDFKIKVKL